MLAQRVEERGPRIEAELVGAPFTSSETGIAFASDFATLSSATSGRTNAPAVATAEPIRNVRRDGSGGGSSSLEGT